MVGVAVAVTVEVVAVTVHPSSRGSSRDGMLCINYVFPLTGVGLSCKSHHQCFFACQKLALLV